VNRFKNSLAVALRVRVALVVLAGLVAAVLTGCGAGQISQMATQEPAVNGNKVTFNNVALRDVRIQAAQTGDYLRPGKSVDLVLVAVNQSPDVEDRLLGITSDIGPVTVTGDPSAVPPSVNCTVPAASAGVTS